MHDRFYHYSSLSGALAVMGIGHDNDNADRTGLIPNRRFIPITTQIACGLPSEASAGGTFGLLEPKPLSWITQDYHAGESMLETILRDMGSRDRQFVLLEVQVDPSDHVFVADQGVHLHPDYQGKNAIDLPITRIVKRQYWDSLVPLCAYDQEKHGYNMPEVVSFQRIPKERIKPICQYDTLRDLLNELRRTAGREELPPPPPPRKIDFSAFKL